MGLAAKLENSVQLIDALRCIVSEEQIDLAGDWPYLILVSLLLIGSMPPPFFSEIGEPPNDPSSATGAAKAVVEPREEIDHGRSRIRYPDIRRPAGKL